VLVFDFAFNSNVINVVTRICDLLSGLGVGGICCWDIIGVVNHLDAELGNGWFGH
jgi:hypothetical protein